MVSHQCLQLTEATIGFWFQDPDGIDIHEEITLWGPETIFAMPGAAAFMKDTDAVAVVRELADAAGMSWFAGPHLDPVRAAIKEMVEWEEHGAAYDQWNQQEVGMDDLHEPSYFLEWNQAEGASTWVGGDQLDKHTKIPQFTPEMLAQRDTLNYFYNFKWNGPAAVREAWGGDLTKERAAKMGCGSCPDMTELLELVSVGDSHGIAKCIFGAVYIPKSAITHLNFNGGAEVGTIFDGEIYFTPYNKFPWRLQHNGVTFTYQDMNGDYAL